MPGIVSRRGFIGASVLAGGAVSAGWAAERAAPARGRMLDVRELGAVGDGRTNDTRAIQHAIDLSPQLGDGIVSLPAGTWLSGTLHLRSHVTLELAAGAVLLASPDDDDFAPHEALPFESGSDTETIDFAHALLAGRDLERIAIRGAGVIDMNRKRRRGPKPIALKRCRFATVQGITIRHSPNYCVSLGGCDDVLIEGVTIRAAYADGIDPDCCRRVRIANCDIESDDDALCLKASFLLGERGVTEDVVVTNCRMRSASNCFKLGTESTGDFRQIVLSNCVFDGSLPGDHDGSAAAEGGGIAVISVDGGTVDGVMISNVVMRDVVAPLFLRLGNRGRDQSRPSPGVLRNVTITGIMAVGATGSASIAGLSGHPVEAVTLENVRISTAGGSRRPGALDVPEQMADYPTVTMYGVLPAFGLYVRHAQDVSLRNVELTVERTDARPGLVADDVSGLHVARLTGWPGRSAGPALWLNDVRGGLIEAGVAPQAGGAFVRVTGAGTRQLTLAGDAYWASESIELAADVGSAAVMRSMGTFGVARR
jgi:polygalacturonase